MKKELDKLIKEFPSLTLKWIKDGEMIKIYSLEFDFVYTEFVYTELMDELPMIRLYFKEEVEAMEELC